MFVQQFMSRPVVTCRPSDTLNTAAQLMWEHDCGAVPVVDADGRLVGIVTDRDVSMAAYTQGRALTQIPVEVAMAKQVHACTPDDAIGEAERMMRENRIRRLPVVNGDNRPIGLLSLADIARAVPSAKDGVMARELTRTLAAISQPTEDRSLTPQGDGSDGGGTAQPVEGWNQPEPATA